MIHIFPNQQVIIFPQIRTSHLSNEISPTQLHPLTEDSTLLLLQLLEHYF